MFGKKKNPERLRYDPALQYPMIRCSICTGEQVAGLKNRQTGKFEEVMVIRGEADLEAFRKIVGTDQIPKEY